MGRCLRCQCLSWYSHKISIPRLIPTFVGDWFCFFFFNVFLAVDNRFCLHFCDLYFLHSKPCVALFIQSKPVYKNFFFCNISKVHFKLVWKLDGNKAIVLKFNEISEHSFTAQMYWYMAQTRFYCTWKSTLFQPHFCNTSVLTSCWSW